MTQISPRHAAARRIAGSYPNPLDLSRPEPCAPETAASLRTAYDAAWDAANAAWDELPGDEPAPAHEEALIAELDAILAREEAGIVMSDSTAVAVIDASPLEFADSPPLALSRRAVIVEPADEDSDAFSNLRHIPEATRTSLAMVLDAAPRRAPRHVHRAPGRDTPAAAPAPVSVRPPRRKRRPVLGTVAIAVVLLGGVAAAVLFLDESGTPIGEQTAGTTIPWIRAQTGVPNSLLARPLAAPAAAETATLPPTLEAGAITAAVPAAEKADERVPATDAVPPLTDDVRIVTTQAVTNGAAPAAAPIEQPAAQTGVTAETWVNMRAGAGADEAVVAVVEPGAQVEVIACENWCEVVVNGQRGFIYNEYLAGLR